MTKRGSSWNFLIQGQSKILAKTLRDKKIWKFSWCFLYNFYQLFFIFGEFFWPPPLFVIVNMFFFKVQSVDPLITLWLKINRNYFIYIQQIWNLYYYNRKFQTNMIFVMRNVKWWWNSDVLTLYGRMFNDTCIYQIFTVLPGADSFTFCFVS